MARMLLIALTVALLALAAACDGTPRAAPPSPTAQPSASPTVSFTPLPPLPAELIDPDSVAKRSGGFVLDVPTGKLWWLRDRLGAWSPDESTLLITGCCSGSGGIQLIDFPSGKATGIYHGDIAAAAWSPDGRRIAFSTSGARGPEDLFVINRDGTGLRQLSTAAGWELDWSPSGDHVALTVGAGLRIIDVQAGESTDVPDTDAWAWSPDGRSLALANRAGLSAYDLATAERRQIAEGPAYGLILWSPDGSRIALPFGERVPLNYGAYAGTPEAGVPPRLVFSLDDPENPVSLGAVRSVAWSPDGKRIAYESEGCITGEWDIFMAAADGGDARRLTSTPEAFKEEPEWSPDGSTIAFVSHDDLALMDVGSGESRSLLLAEDGQGFHLHGSGWGGSSAWSPDGRYLHLAAGGGHGVCD